MLRRPLIALLATTLLAAIAPAAHAGTWTERDRAKDVIGYRFDDEPEPCGSIVEEDRPADRSHDITRLRVAHRADDVRLVATFRDLRATGSHQDSFYIKTADRLWELDVFRFDTWGEVHTIFFPTPDQDAPQGPADDSDEDECGSLSLEIVGGSCAGVRASIDPRTDRVEAVVPRRCLKDPRWVRVGLATHGDLEDSEGTWTIEDHWAPRGSTGDGGIVPPLSPRVRRAR